MVAKEKSFTFMDDDKDDDVVDSPLLSAKFSPIMVRLSHSSESVAMAILSSPRKLMKTSSLVLSVSALQ